MPKNRGWTDAEFIRAVAESISVAGTLKALGLMPNGANYKGFRFHVKRLGLDTSHFRGQGYLKGKSHPGWNARHRLEDVLVEGSAYLNNFQLKKRLLGAALLENRCYECGISEWRGKPLALHLDHRNGVNTDNRIENLRLLCPNCHSQTETFGGKNKGR